MKFARFASAALAAALFAAYRPSVTPPSIIDGAWRIPAVKRAS
jgi:hypothetical protein